MKKAIWALAIVTMIGCTNTKSPNNEIDILDNKEENIDFSKWKSEDVRHEISRILSQDDQRLWQLDQNLQMSEQDLWWMDYDLMWLELNYRQKRLKDMVSQIQEPIILWDLNQPNVAITIDDWYWVESIEYMLNLFEKNNVKATFFVIWDCIKLYPALWKRAIDQWHEICNHTATHSKYFKTWDEPERFERELLWWEKIVKQILWEDYLIKMKSNYPFFRFPWMHWIRVKAYLDILKKYGYIPIWWRYTENPKNELVNNGDIFLWHFKDQDTINVRKSLELILKNGKQAKTVSEIILSDDYQEPIWWHNVYKKKNEVKWQ